MKCLIRLFLAAALLWAAYQIHREALRLVRDATNPMYKMEHGLLEPGREDEAFGPPEDLLSLPENKAKIERGVIYEWIAFAIALSSFTLIILATLPLAVPLFLRGTAWLLVPGFTRDRAGRTHLEPTDVPAEHPTPKETPCGTAGSS